MIVFFLKMIKNYLKDQLKKSNTGTDLGEFFNKS